jgi:hypothetical protein
MNTLEKMPTINAGQVDRLQYELGKLPQCDMPLTHSFIPGFYVRQIFMPKGAIVISRIHKTTHPFVVTKGHAAVMDEAGYVEQIKAGHVGITTPGTRRVLFIHEDSIWTTFHAGNWPADTDPDQIVAEVTETPDVSYIGKLSGEEFQKLTGDTRAI